MGDYHIKMLFDVDAEPAAVRDRLTSTKGIASWWCDNVSGSAQAEGDTFAIRFPDTPAPFDFRVAALDDDHVDWFISDMPPWWANTTVRISVMGDTGSGGSKILFEHRDFDPDNEVIPIVTPAWAQIMLRLKENVETGTSEAFFQTS